MVGKRLLSMLNKKVKKLLPLSILNSKMYRWRKGIMRRLPIKTILGFRTLVRLYRNQLFKIFKTKNGGAFHCIAGPLEQFEFHTFNFDPFEDMIEVDFEGYRFMAPARYHDYLSHRYGDYMQLPPEDQRHPYHGGQYYWKEKKNK